jgi:hypothetical protein
MGEMARQEMEDLMLLEHGEEQERLVHAVRSYAFDGELGMCPTENQITWPRVANLITPATLQRCSIPAHKKTSAGAQDGSEVFDEAPVRPAFGFRDGPGQQRRTRGMNADEVKLRADMDCRTTSMCIIFRTMRCRWRLGR